jgi:hypothetical protein
MPRRGKKVAGTLRVPSAEVPSLATTA